MSFDESKSSLDELNSSLDELNSYLDELNSYLDKLKSSLDELKNSLDKSKMSLIEPEITLDEQKSALNGQERPGNGQERSIAPPKKSLSRKKTPSHQGVAIFGGPGTLPQRMATPVGTRVEPGGQVSRRGRPPAKPLLNPDRGGVGGGRCGMVGPMDGGRLYLYYVDLNDFKIVMQPMADPVTMIGLRYVCCVDAAVPALQRVSATSKTARGLMDLPPLYDPMWLIGGAG